jgi:hypothetical protein
MNDHVDHPRPLSNSGTLCLSQHSFKDVRSSRRSWGMWRSGYDSRISSEGYGLTQFAMLPYLRTNPLESLRHVSPAGCWANEQIDRARTNRTVRPEGRTGSYRVSADCNRAAKAPGYHASRSSLYHFLRRAGTAPAVRRILRRISPCCPALDPEIQSLTERPSRYHMMLARAVRKRGTPAWRGSQTD